MTANEVIGLVGWIILAVLAVLIWLIFFLPYGVDVGYTGGVFRLSIKAGPLRFRLFPKKPLSEKQMQRKERKKAEKQAKKAEKEAQKAADAQNKEQNETIKVTPKKKIDFDTILAILKMGSHAVRRFFRSFTINLFRLHYTVACEDPYDTAVQYGAVCAAAETIPALAGKKIRVQRRDIAIGSDFTSDKPVVEIRIVISLQLFRLVHLAFALGTEFLKWKIKQSRSAKTAAENERDDDNGR